MRALGEGGDEGLAGRGGGGVLSLGLPTHWIRKPQGGKGAGSDALVATPSTPTHRVYHTATSDVIKQTYYTHAYESLRPEQDMKLSRKLAGSLPRRLRKHRGSSERPRSVQGQLIRREERSPSEPQYANTVGHEAEEASMNQGVLNRSSEDDEGLGAEVTSKSNTGDSFTSSGSTSAEVCALGRLAPAPEGSTAGAYCRSKTPASRLGVPPNQGPPPRHLLPKTLKPSPGFKLHPALPASALVNSSHEIRSMALQPATANQRPSEMVKHVGTVGLEETSSAESSSDSFGGNQSSSLTRNSSPGSSSSSGGAIPKQYNSYAVNPPKQTVPGQASAVPPSRQTPPLNKSTPSEPHLGRLSPMVSNLQPSRLHRLQMLQSAKKRSSPKGGLRYTGGADMGYHSMPGTGGGQLGSGGGGRDSETTSLSSLADMSSVKSPNSSVMDNHSTGGGVRSPDLWDVRATKTPIRDLHIMTHNAKHSPVSRLMGGGVTTSSSPLTTAASPSPKVRSNTPRATSASAMGKVMSGTQLSACHFDRLPDSAVVKILSYLNSNQVVRCSRVSRRFYFLAWEPELWTRIDLVNHPDGRPVDADLALKTIIRLLSRNSNKHNNLDSVDLSGCQRLTDRGLAILARRCPNLTRLEVQGCPNITNGGLMDLLTKCPIIDHLDVTGCHMISTVSVHQSANQVIAGPMRGASSLTQAAPTPRRLLNLQYLDLTDCVSLEDSGLKIVVENCPQMLYLFLRRCTNITDVGVKHVASYCLSLRELSLSDCGHVTDLGMHELAKLGPNLRYLSVAKCTSVTDAGVKQLARLCYKLRYLNVRGCEAVSDDALDTLARSCSRLRSLDIGKCDVTDVGLKALSENCPNLKKLSTKSCEMITDQGIQFIAYYCRGLQQLNIQDCPVTVDGYRTVKKFCKRCIIEHSHPGFF